MCSAETMGKAQSHLRGKLPTWGRDKGSGGKLTLTPDPSNILEDQILGTIYGNCIGDAIGLMTEFLNKEQASKVSYMTLGLSKKFGN